MHPDADASEARPKPHADLLVPRRTKAYYRITREAKSLARYAKDRIQSAVAVLVVEQCDCVSARRQVLEQQARFASRDGQPQCCGVALAVREVRSLSRYAGFDHAIGVSQSLKIDFKGSWLGCRKQHWEKCDWHRSSI